MDRCALRMDDLPRAERSVAEAERNVDRQREVVARLKRQGLAATAAEALLARFETILGSTRERLARAQDASRPRQETGQCQ
jgi:hypothetical protein